MSGLISETNKKMRGLRQEAILKREKGCIVEDESIGPASYGGVSHCLERQRPLKLEPP